MDPTPATVLAERSALTLSRAEADHPALTKLCVTMVAPMLPRDPTGMSEGQFWPSGMEQLSRLGTAIGRNTRIGRMEIHFWTQELAEQFARCEAFFDGLRRNDSINKLSILHCVFGGTQCDVLERLAASMPGLEEAVLFSCTLGGDGVAGRVASALAGCGELRTVSIMNSSVRDDVAAEIVSGIRGLRRLRSLDLSMNVIGRAGRGGVEALGTLLKDPSCNLTYLGLGNNGIDDGCAEVLAASLKGNGRLAKLGLGRNNLITERGWGAFVEVLCDTKTIDGTYFSNHALCDLQRWDVPEGLASLLDANEGADKKKIALLKMLRHHAIPHMKTFLEWDLKMLPVAVAWFNDKGRHAEDEADMKARKLTAIYQFARAVPLAIVPPPGTVIVGTSGNDGKLMGNAIGRLLPLLLAFWRWMLSLIHSRHGTGRGGAGQDASDGPAGRRSILLTEARGHSKLAM